MKNHELVRAFANGATEGHTNRLTIIQDTLYSYAMPIAKRQLDGSFIVSNSMAALGGSPVSQTTSTHIGLAHRLCVPNKLVNRVQ